MKRRSYKKAQVKGRESENPISLRVLLLGFITVLVVILLILSAGLGWQQFREHLASSQQMRAQNAATALGLSLSNAVDGTDQAAVATFINALFDHGGFQRVIFTDSEGEVLVSREAPAEESQVPDWFREIAELPVARGHAEVVQGWRRLGQVMVEIDPQQAYQALWQGSVRSVVGFVLVGALAVLLASLGVRLILRPLGQLERQAELLRAHRFDARVPIPRTRELRSVATSANHMAQELEELIAGQIRLIEDLRRETLHDPVTGLDNRASFGQRLSTESESHEPAGAGCLALVSLTGFADLNQLRGYQVGDSLLIRTAELIREFIRQHPGAFAGRRQGADFAVYLPAVEEEDARGWLERLAAELAVAITAVGAEGISVHIGFVVLQPPEEAAEVLARGDTALARARSQHSGAYGVEGLTGPIVSHGGQRWQAALTEALSNERVRLLFQPTFTGNGQGQWFNQVLAQVEIAGEWVGASQFLPLVERYGLAVQLDLPVLDATIEHLKADSGINLCSVLSTASLADAAFRQKLLARLDAQPEVCPRLWVAIHEDAVRQEALVLVGLIPRLRELGVRVLIDRFGVGGVSFDYLQRWVIDGLRIDRSFVRRLDQRADARFFIRSMGAIARSRNVRLFVAGVESAEEWQAAQALEVDGGMGYYLARPSAQPLPPV